MNRQIFILENINEIGAGVAFRENIDLKECLTD